MAVHRCTPGPPGAVLRRARAGQPDERRRQARVPRRLREADADTVVVAYDIVDDRRREDVASLLSGHGPRVQLSVFECEVGSIDELRALRAALRAALRERIDPLEDQVRLYPTTVQTFAERYIIGARTVEERSDYWIVR
ncbi:MAG: CRISPR-associated endonuclease Cas2 [Pseudonocardiaceae bacterium]